MAAELICEESVKEKQKSYAETLALFLPKGFTVIAEPVENTDDVVLSVRTTWNVRFKLLSETSPTQLADDLMAHFKTGMEHLTNAYTGNAIV